jgi:hypothetical protein
MYDDRPFPGITEATMRKIAFLCFSIAFATSGAAFAQALYLPNATSGIGVAAGASTNDDATALSVGVGYSHKSFIDGGVFVHRYGYDAAEMSAIGIQPYANVHLLRQSETIPLSLAAIGSFQKLFFTVADDAQPANGWSFFVGGSAYRHFDLSNTMSVTPQATLGFNFAHTTGTRGLIKRSADDSTLALQLNGNLGYRDGGGRIWALNPYMAIDADYVTFGALLGATFPLH